MPPAAKTKTPKTPKTATAVNTATAATTATATTATERRKAEDPGGPEGAGGPRYQRVADALRERIAAGALPRGAPLPSEAQLIAEYGVSRTTARAAVAALAAEGLITTLHGRGSFVRSGTDRPSLTHHRDITRTPGTGGIAGTGGGEGGGRSGSRRTRRAAPPVYTDSDTDDPRWQPVEPAATYRTDATADLALAFGLPEYAPLFVRDQLAADPAGRRVFHRVYVPFAVAADVAALEADPFRTGGDLYGVLAAHAATAGHALAWTETVRARMPSPDDAAALRIPTGTPLLTIRRATRDDTTGRVLAIEDTRLSADDAQLAYTLTPHDT